MKTIDKQKAIDKFLSELKRCFMESEIYSNKDFCSFIITGSYASWLQSRECGEPSWKSIPDLNLYVLIDSDNGSHLNIAYILAKLYGQIAKKIGLNLLLDLHPFYKSYGIINENMLNIQLTTRVLNVRDTEQYPECFWYGWKSCCVEICGKGESVWDNVGIGTPKRDKKWLICMHHALESYNNAVHMSVMSAMFETDEVIFDEIYRYIKEVLKDGISLAISIGQQFDFSHIKTYKHDLSTFYGRHYGKEMVKIVNEMEAFENNYFAARKQTSIRYMATLFSELLECVYKKGFLARQNELMPEADLSWFKLLLWY